MSTDNTRRWIKGIPYEVAFWQSYYNNRKRLRDLFGWSLIGQECVLDNFDMAAFLAARKEDKPVILDVGCALSYAFGTKIGGKDLEIDFIDPLAPFYNKILDKHKPELPHIKFGMTETLGAIYPENSVTFIHIRNSLDHSMNPMKGILQAVDCLKPGGVLYLNHFRNEAENEGYRGFHQFNIDIRNGRLVLWNATECIDVASELGEAAKVSPSTTPEGRIVAVIEKKAPLGHLIDRRQAGREMVEMAMQTIEYFHSPACALKYHWTRLYCTIGHRTMRLLPYWLLGKIKALAGKN